VKNEHEFIHRATRHEAVIKVAIYLKWK